MNSDLYIADNKIIKFIKENGFCINKRPDKYWFFDTDCDNEFLSLLKLKFGDDIKTYKEICNSAELSYYYARYVIKGAFPEGEAAIATDAGLAYRYAKYVLHVRFTLGELKIFENAYTREKYKLRFNL